MKTYKRIAQLLKSLETVNEDYREMQEDKLANIMDHAPCGSGFDAGTEIEEGIYYHPQQKLIFNSAYHHMNENGYYDGWSSFQIIITPNLSYDYDIKLKSIGKWPVKYAMTKEYIVDCFVDFLDRETNE